MKIIISNSVMKINNVLVEYDSGILPTITCSDDHNGQCIVVVSTMDYFASHSNFTHRSVPQHREGDQMSNTVASHTLT